MKADFLPTFTSAFYITFTKLNIKVGFRGVGLIPLNLESVINKLNIKLKTLTLLGSSSRLVI